MISVAPLCHRNHGTISPASTGWSVSIRSPPSRASRIAQCWPQGNRSHGPVDLGTMMLCDPFARGRVSGPGGEARTDSPPRPTPRPPSPRGSRATTTKVRLHSTLGNVPPIEWELHCRLAQQQAAQPCVRRAGANSQVLVPANARTCPMSKS